MKYPKSFEEGMERLNQALAILNDPATPLADALKAYTEAAALIEYCEGSLEKARVQVEEISAKLGGAEGEVKENGVPEEV